MRARRWFGAGAALVGVGVALGAFGAHGLRARLSPEMLGTFETGVRYQIYHGLAIMGVALGADRWNVAFRAVLVLFATGIVLFAGSLYALALTGARGWGAVTPAGGGCFLLGWGVLAWSVLRSSTARS